MTPGPRRVQVAADGVWEAMRERRSFWKPFVLAGWLSHL
ncbi:hypothetical protein C8C99_1838 [Acidovorax sp. 107]|nr:hypothetical protein C8C99_1838 [Acidovorax sp. 107]